MGVPSINLINKALSMAEALSVTLPEQCMIDDVSLSKWMAAHRGAYEKLATPDRTRDTSGNFKSYNVNSSPRTAMEQLEGAGKGNADTDKIIAALKELINYQASALRKADVPQLDAIADTVKNQNENQLRQFNQLLKKRDKVQLELNQESQQEMGRIIDQALANVGFLKYGILLFLSGIMGGGLIGFLVGKFIN